MRRVSIVAALLCGPLDLILTSVLALPVVIIANIQAQSWTLPKAEQTQALFSVLQQHPGLYAASIALGSCASIVAGFVAARIARRAPLLNGAISAWLCIASGVYAMFQANSFMPTWQSLVLLPLSPALGALGGWLWQRRSQRKAKLAPMRSSAM